MTVRVDDDVEAKSGSVARRDSRSLSLAGVRVLVTRAGEQAAALTERLVILGAEVRELATIAIEPVVDPTALEAALARITSFDWIVFTSANGVARGLGGAPLWRPPQGKPGDVEDARDGTLSLPRIAAVGRSTAAALRRRGVEPAFEPTEANGEALADQLPIRVGEKVLLLRSDLAGGELPHRLMERGATVEDVSAYRVVPRSEMAPELRAQLTSDGIDAALLASPSAARGLVAACRDPRLLDRVAIVTIGPSTTRAALELGLKVAGQAREQSAEGLVAVLRDVVAGWLAGDTGRAALSGRASVRSSPSEGAPA